MCDVKKLSGRRYPGTLWLINNLIFWFERCRGDRGVVCCKSQLVDAVEKVAAKLLWN